MNFKCETGHGIEPTDKFLLPPAPDELLQGAVFLPVLFRARARAEKLTRSTCKVAAYAYTHMSSITSPFSTAHPFPHPGCLGINFPITQQHLSFSPGSVSKLRQYACILFQSKILPVNFLETQQTEQKGEHWTPSSGFRAIVVHKFLFLL